MNTCSSKTLQGLVPVRGLLKRVDDAYLDPLELRATPRWAWPAAAGCRAGNVMLANAAGSAFRRARLCWAFCPALARHVLEQALLLPSLPHLVVRRAQRHAGGARLRERTIKPTYPAPSCTPAFESAMGAA